MQYLIKKGNHYASGLHLGVHFSITEQKYRVKFSKECIYTPDWENDWNKLCGWSYGLHHHNSIRVCWRPQVVAITSPTGRIELCIYTYENSVRKISEKVLVVDIDKELDLELLYDVTSKYITLHYAEYGVDLSYTTKPTWGYRLYPYIGGDNVATVDTRIELERL